jgi:diguanylate cyclase (GGDEF)-like protein
MAERRNQPTVTGPPSSTVAGMLLGAGLVSALALWTNAVLFHCLVGLYAAVVAACIAMIAWNTRALCRHDYMLALGVAMVPVACTLAIHILADPQMRVFTTIKPAASAQLGLIARVWTAGALLIAPRFLHRRLDASFTLAAVVLVGIALIGATLHTGLLPTTLGELGADPRLLHAAHGLVVILCLGALASHHRASGEFQPRMLRAVIGAISLTMVAELFFANATGSREHASALGHAAQLFSFVLLYWALVHIALAEPYALMFRRLTDNLQTLERQAHRDHLTGLHNLRGLTLLGEAQLALAQRLGWTVTVVFIDLNGMKRINDEHGHDAGDRALQDTARLLCDTFREADVTARVGGDEFVVLLTHGDGQQPIARLREALARHEAGTDRPYTLSLAIGATMVVPGQAGSLQDILRQADRAMYTDKQRYYQRRSEGPEG